MSFHGLTGSRHVRHVAPFCLRRSILPSQFCDRSRRTVTKRCRKCRVAPSHRTDVVIGQQLRAAWVPRRAAPWAADSGAGMWPATSAKGMLLAHQTRAHEHVGDGMAAQVGFLHRRILVPAGSLRRQLHLRN